MRDSSLHYFLSFLLLILLIAAAGCSGTQTPSDKKIPTGTDQGNTWRIDHAVIIVDNLTASMEKSREAGFNVVSGGENADNFTHNALIPFKDGSYLELFAATDPATPAEMRQLVASGIFDTAMAGLDAMQKRFMCHLAEGSGLRDFAVSSPGLNISEVQRLAERGGFTLEGPIPMSRTRPDGIVVQWEVAVPVFEYSSCVPFLIVDDTPRALRVPDGNMTEHPNGAAGIGSIEIATHDPAEVSLWYDTILSISPESRTVNLTSYVLEGSVITIRKITGDGTEGPVRLLLETDTGGVLAMEDVILG